MTPTSTERRADATFRRAFAAVVVALAVLTAGFLAAGYLQGPKLSSAQVDLASVIAQPGQQLRLFANQSLAQIENSQVTITPEAPHSVTTQGAVVAVQFGARLQYDTEYTVRIDDVRSLYEAQPGTLTYSFRTLAPELYYLDRGQPADDIVRTTIGGTGRDVVYSAPRIQGFAVAGGALVVATLDPDDTSTLSLVSLTDGAVERVPLPEPGVVQKLQASATGTLVGFTFTSAGASLTPKYSSTLLILDLQGGRTMAPVLGIDGSPARVLDWEFMPDGTGLLAFTRERTLSLIDPATPGSVIPLGQYTGLGPVSRDGTVVTMTDALGTAALTIADGSQVRLGPSPLENDSSLTYLGPVEATQAGRIEKLVIADPSGKRFASAIAVDDGTHATVIYRTPNDAGSIESFSVSPNGQYIAVRLVPDVSAAVSDGYFYDAASTSTETVIIGLDGTVVRSVEGFGLVW